MKPSNNGDFVTPITTVSLPADLSELEQINQRLEQLLTGDMQPLLLKTELIVEELLANICSYAYVGKSGQAYFACGVVNFDGKRAILIQLSDHGHAFDPFANARDPDLNLALEDRPIGGLGLHLVREIASHYAYIRIDDCNQTQIILTIDGQD